MWGDTSIDYDVLFHSDIRVEIWDVVRKDFKQNDIYIDFCYFLSI